MTLLSQEEQWQESCGSLAAFEQHGHTRAWGLFGYPNNKWTTDIQRNVVSTCFAYGRKYSWAWNRRDRMVEPWFQQTFSIGGGRCNNSALPCSTLASTTHRYEPPTSIANLFNVGTDRWAVVQMYRFVTGASSTKYASWDCTSANWWNHWTMKPELYCWDDFVYALDHIPDGVTVTDPATVATAWGRSPG
jgi:hypothetical protein